MATLTSMAAPTHGSVANLMYMKLGNKTIARVTYQPKASFGFLGSCPMPEPILVGIEWIRSFRVLIQSTFLVSFQQKKSVRLDQEEIK
jgi:hypothetical protein